MTREKHCSIYGQRREARGLGLPLAEEGVVEPGKGRDGKLLARRNR